MTQYWLSDPWRGDPLPSVEELRRGLDDLFQRASGSALRRAGAHPPVNLYETADAYFLTAELPGLGREDLDISIDGNRITLRGERHIDHPADASLHRAERRAGTFRRTFELPKNIDADKVQAKHRNGVLMVQIPKAEQNQPRRIAVEGS